MSAQRIQFPIHHDAYYAETWRGPLHAWDRTYWIRPVPGGWQVSRHNDQADDDLEVPHRSRTGIH